MINCIKVILVSTTLFFEIIIGSNAATANLINARNVERSYGDTDYASQLSLVSGEGLPESCAGFFEVIITTLEDGLFEISECLRELKANRISYERASQTIEYIYKNTLVNHVNYLESRDLLNSIVNEVCHVEMFGEKLPKEDVVDLILFVQGRGLWGKESKEVIRNLRVLSRIDMYSDECLSAFEILER